MKAIATSETISGSTDKGRAAWSSYIVFALCSLLYLLPFMRIIALASDEGTVLYGAVRIAHGQVFARDFFEIMGPGSFYWLATFYKVFGVTFIAARICLLVSSFGSALLLFFLSRRVCKRYHALSCIVIVGTCFGGMWPGNSYHVDATFFALLSVACLVLWLDRGWHVLMISAGVFAGLSTCCLQTKGTLILLAMILWLWLQRRKGAASNDTFFLLIGGYLGVAGAVVGYFWSQGALKSLFHANVTWPFQHYSNVNAVGYGQGIIIWNWNRYILMKDAFGWPGSAVAYGVAVLLIVPLFFIAAIPVLVPLSALLSTRAVQSKLQIFTPEVIIYLLCGFALWISEIHRMDIGHLAFGAPLLVICCICFLDEVRSKYTDNVLKLIAIFAVSLAGFNFIGVLTAHSVVTRVGSVAVFRDSPALSFLNTRVAAGDEIYVYPYAPTYYFLSATTNPTPYSLLLYNYNSPTEFQEVIGILDRRRVKYVIWDTPILAYTAISFPGAQPKSAKDLIMEPYLESHYRMVSEDRGIRVMERKEDSTGN